MGLPIDKEETLPYLGGNKRTVPRIVQIISKNASINVVNEKEVRKFIFLEYVQIHKISVLVII